MLSDVVGDRVDILDAAIFSLVRDCFSEQDMALDRVCCQSVRFPSQS